jgi:hypothetical protein
MYLNVCCFGLGACRYPDETVICVSHGGPTQAAFRSMCPERAAALKGQWDKLACGYTGLFIFVEDSDTAGKWSAPVAACQEHLARVGEGTWDGDSSFAEQTAK